ncbi:hypothetical protein [Lacipirellula parvula]|nr:hypothetical protein [Lacipirellula parvula]
MELEPHDFVTYLRTRGRLTVTPQLGGESRAADRRQRPQSR